MKAFPVILGLVCVLAAPPAAALDPLTLVLRILRDHIISTQLESMMKPGVRRPPVPEPAPPAREHDLRRLVDHGFPHLDTVQREAVHARLAAVVNDPQHASQREVILDQFAAAAAASRSAHQALATLSDAQKKRVAVEAAEAYRGRPPEEMERIVVLLRSPGMPIPSDLRELMLAELSAGAASP